MKSISGFAALGLLFLVSLLLACGEPAQDDSIDVFDPTPFTLQLEGFSDPQLPTDNPLTYEGILLGRMLFYDPMLSGNNTQSCSSCHNQLDGFSDSRRFSPGIEGIEGTRQAMPIVNLAWHSNGFFWDGRSTTLREQALEPIQDPIEMNASLEEVISKLEGEDTYRQAFFDAFGSDRIDSERIAMALEQFMLSVTSNESKYDQYLAGNYTLTESEERGKVLFESEYNPFFPEISGADCAHCHSGINFENDKYMNNGLDLDQNHIDLGFEVFTGNVGDRAKFKVPTLRNIEYTAPYMHDGRFQTLEQVIDHYDHGIQTSSTVDPTVLYTQDTGLQLSAQDKEDLINFLKCLSDPSFLENPAYQSPF